MNQKSNKGSNQPLSTYRSLLSMDNVVSKKTNVTNKASDEKSSRGFKRSRSKSPLRDRKSRSYNKSDAKKEKIVNHDIPDRSYGDLYCKACDSHMNSEDMWAMHLQGKRHLKNTKSSAVDLEAERKHDYVDEKPEAQDAIDDERSPIVGLQHVCELQRLEQRPLYSCFICSATIANSRLLIEHLLGLKHRMAYLKEHDPDRYNLIHESALKKGQIEPVVAECIEKHERDSGRGKMIVKKEKFKAASTWSSKKTTKEYDDYPARRPEREDKNYSEWSRLPLHHSEKSSDYIYGDRERLYKGGSSSSQDNFYSERLNSRMTDEEQPYVFRESSRNEDLSYYRRPTVSESLSRDEPADRNYRLSTAVNNRLPNASESRFGDLREFLEKKKTPSLDSNIPDEVLGIISALPTISFFQLVLFKLDNLKIEEDVEIKFLDRVVNRATTLAMNIKSKLLTPTLRMKFKESMVQNGIEVENDIKEPSKDVQNLLEMVGECKAMSNMKTQNATSNMRTHNATSNMRTHNATMSYPASQSGSLDVLDKFLPPSKPSYSASNPIPSYSSYSSSSYSSKSEMVGRRAESSYVQPYPPLPAQNPVPSAYSSSYSSSCAIPGLTLTQGGMSPNKSTATSSPFDQLEAQAKSIFGISQWGVGQREQSSKYGY